MGPSGIGPSEIGPFGIGPSATAASRRYRREARQDTEQPDPEADTEPEPRDGDGPDALSTVLAASEAPDATVAPLAAAEDQNDGAAFAPLWGHRGDATSGQPVMDGPGGSSPPGSTRGGDTEDRAGGPAVWWLSGGGLLAAGAAGAAGGGVGAGSAQAPVPPVSGAPGGMSLGLVKTTGIVSGLPSTNDPAIHIANLEADAVWFYRVDGASWVQGQGDEIPASLITQQGAHQVDVYQMDLAGNISETASLNFWLDTLAPDAPMVQIKNNTGDSSDTLTSDATLIVQGLQPGDEWFYQVDGQGWVPGQGQEVPDAAIGTDGDHVIQIIVRDATGNESAPTTVQIQRDTTAPETGPTVALNQDTGVRGDGITSVPTLRFGGLEPGAQWSVSLDGGQTWRSAGTDPDGLFSDNAAFTRDGTWTVLARQTDAAGNVGTALTSFTFELDRQAPATPTLSLANDTGVSSTDRITRDGTVRIEGLEAGGRWTYSLDGVPAGMEATGDELLPDGWDDGHHVLEVIAFDAAGNASGKARLEFVLDTQAPGLPSLSLLDLMPPVPPVI